MLAIASVGAQSQTPASTLTGFSLPYSQSSASPGASNVRALSLAFAGINAPIAGIAADEAVVFVGEPLNGKVVALSGFTAKPIGELPPPPAGFAVPFIMHSIGSGRVAVLDAGGLPAPNPFVPVSPFIYEIQSSVQPGGRVLGNPCQDHQLCQRRRRVSRGLRAARGWSLPVIGFRAGSVWVANEDGSIAPGIVPKSFNPQDLIPTLALCLTMPQITVNGVPFLFTGSTLPGISPMAVREGTVYFYSPCARGIYTFPLSILSDRRTPDQRAVDIRLLAPTPGRGSRRAPGLRIQPI